MAERIRGYGGEEQSSVDLFNMSDRRERTWDHCRGLLPHFGEFFPLTQKLASLNPKRGSMQEEFQQKYNVCWSTSCQFCDLK